MFRRSCEYMLRFEEPLLASQSYWPRGKKWIISLLFHFPSSPGIFCIDPVNFCEQAKKLFMTSLGFKYCENKLTPIAPERFEKIAIIFS